MFEQYTIFQIILAIIAIIFLFISIKKFISHEERQTIFKFFLSFFVWGVVLLFSLAPESARILSQTLHLGGNLNTLIFAGFIIIFLVIFRILTVIERIERDISDIVKEEALQNMRGKS